MGVLGGSWGAGWQFEPFHLQDQLAPPNQSLIQDPS